MAGEEGKSKSANKPAPRPVGRPRKAAAMPTAVKIQRTAPLMAPPVKARPVEIAPIAAPAAKTPKAVAAPAVPAPVKATPVKAEPLTPATIKPKKVKAAIRTAPVSGKATPALTPPIAQKEKIMDMTSSFTPSGIQDVIAEAQDKAKAAFEKSSTMMTEAGEFARGNVEAIVESGKVLASGLQDLGTTLASEGRSAFETMTADLKELAAAKTPADFLKIQSELIRKSFDGAGAYGSKNSEAVLKLATEAFAPISGRVSLAVEKARTTSL